MNETKHKRFPLWLQLIAILLIGILTSLVVFFFVQDSKIKRFTVKFADGNGNVIEERVVKSGKGVVPPVFDTDLVFRGWDTTINNITSDVEAHPSFYRIVEDNLIYFNSVYAREGTNFTIELTLSGNVNVSGGKFELTYDDEVMTYKAFEGNEVVKVTNASPGKLVISFNSNDVLTEKTTLAKIEFYAEKRDVNYSQLCIKANEAYLTVNGDKKPVDCATINNKIYFLQEVE